MADPGHIGGPKIVRDCVEIRLLWTLATGKEVVNVVHAQVASTYQPTPATSNAVLAAITNGATWVAYAGILNIETLIRTVDQRDIRGANFPLVPGQSANTPGTGVGNAVPPGSALVITERTASAGRANRGRIYAPGLNTAALGANGDLSGPNVAIALAWWQLVMSSIGANIGPLVIAQVARAGYTGSTGTVHPPRPDNHVAVTQLQIRTGRLQSQRRRAQV